MNVKFSEKKIIGRICPKCFNAMFASVNMKVNIQNQYNGEYDTCQAPRTVELDPEGIRIRCPFCGTVMFDVDRGILIPVAKLNEFGYTTVDSCEGHLKHSDIETDDVDDPESRTVVSSPYLVFKSDLSKESKRSILDAYNDIVNSDEKYGDFILRVDRFNVNDPEHQDMCSIDDPDTEITIEAQTSAIQAIFDTNIVHGCDGTGRLLAEHSAESELKKLFHSFKLLLCDLVIKLSRGDSDGNEETEIK